MLATIDAAAMHSSVASPRKVFYPGLLPVRKGADGPAGMQATLEGELHSPRLEPMSVRSNAFKAAQSARGASDAPRAPRLLEARVVPFLRGATEQLGQVYERTVEMLAERAEQREADGLDAGPRLYMDPLWGAKMG